MAMGLYRFDTVLFAMTFKGTDVVTLVLSVPLLIVAFILYRRNLLRGGLLLLSAIPYFIYIGASMAFSAAFNSAFLLYVALFSVSLFTFLAVISTIDLTCTSAPCTAGISSSGTCDFFVHCRVGNTLSLAQ